MIKPKSIKKVTKYEPKDFRAKKRNLKDELNQTMVGGRLAGHLIIMIMLVIIFTLVIMTNILIILVIMTNSLTIFINMTNIMFIPVIMTNILIILVDITSITVNVGQMGSQDINTIIMKTVSSSISRR